MTVATLDIVDQAIAWHLRLDGASEDEWVAFTDWLEADGAHADAYDRIVLDDALVAPALDLRRESQASLVHVDRQRSAWRRRGGWLVAGTSALAASLAVAVFVPGSAPHAAALTVITTAPGEHRTVALADGTRIELNGGSELAYSAGDARSASLRRGEAVFHVTHNPKAPFELTSGEATLRDIGTVFDVTREGDRLGVQVAEGAVMFRPDREAVTVKQGMALAMRDTDDRIVLRRIDAAVVGTWRDNRLSFRETPLRDVAAAMRRTTGEDLHVADAIAETPFTGTIRLVNDEGRNATQLAALAGLSARRTGGGWVLTSVVDAPN